MRAFHSQDGTTGHVVIESVLGAGLSISRRLTHALIAPVYLLPVRI